MLLLAAATAFVPMSPTPSSSALYKSKIGKEVEAIDFNTLDDVELELTTEFDEMTKGLSKEIVQDMNEVRDKQGTMYTAYQIEEIFDRILVCEDVAFQTLSEVRWLLCLGFHCRFLSRQKMSIFFKNFFFDLSPQDLTVVFLARR